MKQIEKFWGPYASLQSTDMLDNRLDNVNRVLSNKADAIFVLANKLSMLRIMNMAAKYLEAHKNQFEDQYE